MDETGRPNAKGIDFPTSACSTAWAPGIQGLRHALPLGSPQHLEDRGGWLNRELAYRFADYADLMTRELRGRGGPCLGHLQ